MRFYDSSNELRNTRDDPFLASTAADANKTGTYNCATGEAGIFLMYNPAWDTDENLGNDGLLLGVSSMNPYNATSGSNVVTLANAPGTYTLAPTVTMTANGALPLVKDAFGPGKNGIATRWGASGTGMFSTTTSLTFGGSSDGAGVEFSIYFLGRGATLGNTSEVGLFSFGLPTATSRATQNQAELSRYPVDAFGSILTPGACSNVPKLRPIVTSGIGLLLDAGDAVSYPGTGTTWTDKSGGNYHGTLTNGPGYIARPGAIVFDGTNDSVVGTATGSLFNGAHTISCWFYRTATASWSDLVASHVTAGGCSILRFLDTVNTVGTHNAGSNSGKVGVDLGNDHLNQWIYATVVFSSASIGGTVNVYAYKAGVLLTATGTMDWNLAASGQYTVGKCSSGNYHTGMIAHIAVYNRALTREEVEQNYNALKGRYTSGLGLLLDAGDAISYPGTGTNWTDIGGGGNSGILTNGPTYSRAYGGYIEFDGVNDYVTGTIPSATFAGAHTISCWFYRRVAASWNGVFSNSVGVGSGSMLTFTRNSSVIGTFQLNVNGDLLAASIDLGADHVNQWIYVTIVYAGATSGSAVTMYAYKNGALLSSSGRLYWSLATTSSYWIGRNDTNSSFNGYIPHVAVYNRALTAAEVDQNYNALKGRYTTSGGQLLTGNVTDLDTTWLGLVGTRDSNTYPKYQNTFEVWCVTKAAGADSAEVYLNNQRLSTSSAPRWSTNASRWATRAAGFWQVGDGSTSVDRGGASSAGTHVGAFQVYNKYHGYSSRCGIVRSLMATFYIPPAAAGGGVTATSLTGGITQNVRTPAFTISIADYPHRNVQSLQDYYVFFAPSGTIPTSTRIMENNVTAIDTSVAGTVTLTCTAVPSSTGAQVLCLGIASPGSSNTTATPIIMTHVGRTFTSTTLTNTFQIEFWFGPSTGSYNGFTTLVVRTADTDSNNWSTVYTYEAATATWQDQANNLATNAAYSTTPIATTNFCATFNSIKFTTPVMNVKRAVVVHLGNKSGGFYYSPNVTDGIRIKLNGAVYATYADATAAGLKFAWLSVNSNTVATNMLNYLTKPDSTVDVTTPATVNGEVFSVYSPSFGSYFTLGSSAEAYGGNAIPIPGQYAQSDITKQSCLRITFPK